MGKKKKGRKKNRKKSPGNKNKKGQQVVININQQPAKELKETKTGLMSSLVAWVTKIAAM